MKGAMGAHAIRDRLAGLADEGRAREVSRYFKTGPGGYGEGDVFLGISMPDLRSLAKTCGEAGMEIAGELLGSPVHEERMLALLMLMRLYAKGSLDRKADIFHFYLRNTRGINNWDLVDVSAPHIVGSHLLEGDKGPLDTLARSEILWERRIAIVSTLAFIRKGVLEHTFGLALILLHDREDLMHKAVGWMLREAGKKDEARLRTFLDDHGAGMPRTMLRSAIERFTDDVRARCLAMGKTGRGGGKG